MCCCRVEVLLREYDVSCGKAMPDPGALLAQQAHQAAEGTVKRHKPAEVQRAAAPGVGEAASKPEEAEDAVRPPGVAASVLPAPARVTARPISQGRGHTGYLTFARKAVPMRGAPAQAVAQAE
jgi:hypothetical protein